MPQSMISEDSETDNDLIYHKNTMTSHKKTHQTSFDNNDNCNDNDSGIEYIHNETHTNKNNDTVSHLTNYLFHKMSDHNNNNSNNENKNKNHKINNKSSQKHHKKNDSKNKNNKQYEQTQTQKTVKNIKKKSQQRRYTKGDKFEHSVMELFLIKMKGLWHVFSDWYCIVLYAVTFFVATGVTLLYTTLSPWFESTYNLDEDQVIPPTSNKTNCLLCLLCFAGDLCVCFYCVCLNVANTTHFCFYILQSTVCLSFVFFCFLFFFFFGLHVCQNTKYKTQKQTKPTHARL